jgi:hypothetical protein
VSLLRRKQQTPEEQVFQQALGEPFDREEDAAADDDPDSGGDVVARADAHDDGRLRLDFGALQVPAVDGMQVRADLDDEQVVAVSVMIDGTVLQMQAFAAPRSEAVWDEVRQDIAEGIRGNQGKAREAEGPFGRELHAEIPVIDPAGATVLQPARFVGIDGDRWFLRGVVTGPGATDPARAAAVEEIFADVVVVRGSHAAPPRDPLPLRLPPDAQPSDTPPSDGAE